MVRTKSREMDGDGPFDNIQIMPSSAANTKRMVASRTIPVRAAYFKIFILKL